MVNNKTVEIIFENGDVIAIDQDDINCMNVSHIYENVEKSRNVSGNSIKQLKYCKAFKLCLKKSADKRFSSDRIHDVYSVFGRFLASDDVIGVTFHTDKNQMNTIYFPWKLDDDDDEMINHYQTTSLVENGGLEIIIDETDYQHSLVHMENKNTTDEKVKVITHLAYDVLDLYYQYNHIVYVEVDESDNPVIYYQYQEKCKYVSLFSNEARPTLILGIKKVKEYRFLDLLNELKNVDDLRYEVDTSRMYFVREAFDKELRLRNELQAK